MGITKLTAMAGDAEIMGEVRSVLWNDKEGLLVKGLTLEEAMRALGLLSAGVLAAVKLPPAPWSPSQQKQPEAVARTAPPPVACGGCGPEVNEKPAQPDKFPSHTPVEEKRPDQIPGIASPLPEGMTLSPAPSEEAKPVELKPEPKKKEAKPTTDANKLAKFTSLGEVVVFLYEQGITAVDGLVEECSALKSTVPLLGRIQNLDERVRRAYEVKGLGVQQ